MTLASSRVVQVVLLLCFFLTGCRTLSAPTRSDGIWQPPKWEAPGSREDGVWRTLRSPNRDISDGPLTVLDVVAIALERNPSTRQAWYNARSADAVKNQKIADWYPAFTASGDINGVRKISDHQIDDADNYDYGGHLTLTYLLLDAGGRSARVKEAYQTLLSENFKFNRTMQDLILNAQESYYALYSAGAAVEAARANLEDAKTAYEAAEDKYEAGLVSKLDVLQAKSDYDNALYEVEDMIRQLNAARADLASVMAVPADTPFEISPPEKEVPHDISTENVSSLIEEAFKIRPDILSGRASLKAQDAALAAAVSDFWPSVNLSAGTDAARYKYFGYLEREGEYYDFTGGVTVSWDIFDGFNKANIIKEARANLAAEREALIQAEIAASADVWTKYYNYNAAVRKLSYSEAYLESTDSSYQLAFEGYKVGLKNILDVLKAQSSLAEARNRLIQSRKELFNAAAEMAHATGVLGLEEQTR